MHVVHVLPWSDAQGSFGGPVRVAYNQAEALARQDVRVTIVSLGQETQVAPIGQAELRRFAARAWPSKGFVLKTSRSLEQYLSVVDADVIHLHAGRHVSTLRAGQIARRRGLPYFVQTHGMVPRASSTPLRVYDRLYTSKCLTKARSCFALTLEDENDIRRVAPEARIERLNNGVPAQKTSHDEVSRPAKPEVLFLGRLHERKRPLLLVKAVEALRREGAEVDLAFVGPDEGQLTCLQEHAQSVGSAASFNYEGTLSYGEVSARIRRCTVFVLPSINEPFPMAALEAMALGVPVICTSSCGLAGAIRQAGAGLVVDETLSGLVDALREALSDQDAATRMGVRARALVRAEFDMDSVAKRLVQHYAKAAS